MTCVLASTAVLGATQANASPWDCNVTGSLDQSGGPTNPIPWLNGTDGKLPELQGRTSAVEYITGALSPNQTVERFNASRHGSGHHVGQRRRSGPDSFR
ncbi:hypothetical protein ACETU7_19080 [Rhodococcus sp. 3Y1]